jgi:hypothetical protein
MSERLRSGARPARSGADGGASRHAIASRAAPAIVDEQHCRPPLLQLDDKQQRKLVRQAQARPRYPARRGRHRSDRRAGQGSPHARTENLLLSLRSTGRPRPLTTRHIARISPATLPPPACARTDAHARASSHVLQPAGRRGSRRRHRPRARRPRRHPQPQSTPPSAKHGSSTTSITARGSAAGSGAPPRATDARGPGYSRLSRPLRWRTKPSPQLVPSSRSRPAMRCCWWRMKLIVGRSVRGRP